MSHAEITALLSNLTPSLDQNDILPQRDIDKIFDAVFAKIQHNATDPILAALEKIAAGQDKIIAMLELLTAQKS
jgi:formate dehydrogenase maturation protein FdhE